MKYTYIDSIYNNILTGNFLTDELAGITFWQVFSAASCHESGAVCQVL